MLPSADLFSVGDVVAATSDFRIGGVPVVEKGCRGTVTCFGESPDGSVGVSVQFDARKDGSALDVLCRPHEIQLVPAAAHASSLGHHVRRALESLRASAGTLCQMLPAQPQLAPGVPARASAAAAGEPSSGSQRGKLRQRRKADDGSRHVGQDDVDDEFELPRGPSRRIGWGTVLIVVLVLANLLLAYVRIRKHAGKHNLHVVMIFTDDSLAKHILSHPGGTLVNFYASSCEPCAKLAPKFEEAAKQLQNTPISFASVNASLTPAAVRQYSVSSLPTLLWFRRGRLVKEVASSVRSVVEILEFVHEALQPSVIEFRSYDEFLEAVPQLRTVLSKGKTPPIVAGFGPDPAVREVVEQVGEKYRGETAFLVVPEGRPGHSGIRAYFRDAAADKDYNGSLTVDDFLSWLQPYMAE